MTYDYNASALGLGGVLKNADGTTTGVPSLASVHLAPTGGEGFAEVSNYSKDGISFTTAKSKVFGSDSGYRTFTTYSDVYITHLNLFGRVEAEILQMSITSTRVVEDVDISNQVAIAEQSNPDNARFTMNAMVRGLVIDGVEVIPELDLELTACPTYEQLVNRIKAVGAGPYAAQLGVNQTALETVLTTNVQPIRTSFVKTLEYAPTDKFGVRSGITLPVKSFGTVHFGELVVKPGHRHASLLRIAFDSNWGNNEEGLEPPSISPFGGSMTILNNVGNGAPSWP